jgi:hypothetical protein
MCVGRKQGRATGRVQPRFESTLKILEASWLLESPTGRQPVLKTTSSLSKTVLFGQYRYYFVAVRTYSRERTDVNLGQIFKI